MTNLAERTFHPRLAIFMFDCDCPATTISTSTTQRKMSTFEPVVSVLIAAVQNAKLKINLGLMCDDSCQDCHRRERSSPWPSREYRCEAITQWPEDCGRSMRGTEHIWGILPRQTLVDLSRRNNLVLRRIHPKREQDERTAARQQSTRHRREG